MKYRENFIRNAYLEAAGGSKSSKLITNYIKDQQLGPDITCCSCLNLFFKHQVQVINFDSLKKQLANFSEDILKFEGNAKLRGSEYACRTCVRSMRKGEIPVMTSSPNLSFPTVPECVKVLSPLEKTMVSPYIPFNANPGITTLFIKWSVVT